jgi:HSP20 family protein
METRYDMAQRFFIQHGVQIAGAAPAHSQLVWQPAVDLYRCTGGWLLKVELAGVRQEDVQIAADSRGITVSGIRRDLRHFESQETHMMEIAYSRFERFVALPEPVEDVQVRTECREGMLYVRVITAEKREHR